MVNGHKESETVSVLPLISDPTVRRGDPVLLLLHLLWHVHTGVYTLTSHSTGAINLPNSNDIIWLRNAAENHENTLLGLHLLQSECPSEIYLFYSLLTSVQQTSPTTNVCQITWQITSTCAAVDNSYHCVYEKLCGKKTHEIKSKNHEIKCHSYMIKSYRWNMKSKLRVRGKTYTIKIQSWDKND